MPFTLTPEVVPLLCQALMAGIAGGYVLSLPRKTRSAWWLGALLLGNALFATSFMLGMLSYGSAAWSARFSMGLYVGVGIAGLAGLRLAYGFLGRPFRREERWACGLAALALAGLVAATAATVVTLDERLFEPLLYGYGFFLLATTGGALAVHLRQTRRYRDLARQAPTRQAARHAAADAHVAMAGLSGLTLVLAIINALATVGAVPPLVINYASLILELALDVGLIVVFVNHAPERTTVQAKLVGVSLGAVLALVGLTSLALLRPVELAEAAGNTVPAELTVRFEARAGGYRVTRSAAADGGGDASASWQPLDAGGEFQTLALPFAFPIGGQRFQTVDVWAVPLLAFGAEAPCTRACVGVGAMPAPTHPVVLPFSLPTDADAGRTVAVRPAPDRFDVRWEVRGPAGERSEHQATLFPDGSAEIRYRGPERHPRGGAAGLHPGGTAVASAAFAWAGLTVPAGTAVLDPYGARFAELAHARTLRMLPFVLGATGFVLLLIPLFLRRGVLGPLADLLTAVDRVDRGERGVRVPTRSTDEVGALGRRFNRMSASLGAAEAELRAYALTLEGRVAERTHALRDANATLAEQRDALAASLDALRTTQARLVQAEKQASLGRLTAGIAHELRNPLNFVTGFAELSAELADELGEALRAEPGRTAAALAPDAFPLLDDLRGNTERVLEHGRRAERIVEAMVLHAPSEPSPHRLSDLNALLRLAAEGASRAYTADRGAVAPIELDLGPDVGDVDVQAEGVVQVAVSLLENALHAVDDTGGGVCLRSRRGDETVTVEVADHGVGMDAETASRAFEPFFTTKPPGEGTGLGLSLAYDIVTAGHGGAIELETAPGAGTTFTVHLPVDPPDARRPARSGSRATRASFLAPSGLPPGVAMPAGPLAEPSPT